MPILDLDSSDRPLIPHEIRCEVHSVLLDKIIADYKLKSEDAAETGRALLRRAVAEVVP
jgi:hypothetical protein